MIEWKRSAVDDKIILFIIEVKKRDGDKWQIEKRYFIYIYAYRYSEFDELNKTLKKTHTNLPPLPGKSFFKL